MSGKRHVCVLFQTSYQNWCATLAVLHTADDRLNLTTKSPDFPMATVALRSPSDKLGGLFYFARMLDKIRLHARDALPGDYHGNLGKGFDELCANFLRIDYEQLVQRVKQGGTDEEILRWCFENGRRPNENDTYVWNEFMRKRGWNDEISEALERRKREAGMTGRSDIQTSFQFIDADEGRLSDNR